MTRSTCGFALALLGALAVVPGCGSKGGGGGAALDFPADTTALVGFVRKGDAPSGTDMRAAVVALVGEDIKGPENEVAFNSCIEPVTASLEGATIAVLGEPDDGRVVVRARGKGLRAAVDGCLGKMSELAGKPFKPGQAGDLTLYPLDDEDELVALWQGDDRVVIGNNRALVTATAAAKGGLGGTPLGKALADVDTSAALWLAAAGPALVEAAKVESATGSIGDLTGSARVRFASPEGAQQAFMIVQEALPKGAKVDGALLTISMSVRDLPGLIEPGRATLSEQHARTLLAGAPMILPWLFLAGDSSDSAPTTVNGPVGIVADPVAPVTPPEPLEPPPPPAPAAPEPPPPAPVNE